MKRTLDAKITPVNVKPKASTGNRTKRPAVSGKEDVRIVKTRYALGHALTSLMQEQPFEEITVQTVLDRAGVSRSTFYAHYVHKDDLFLSSVDGFCEKMAGMLSRRGENSSRVAPIRELFAHVADVQQFGDAMVSAGKWNDVVELMQGHFARGIERRLSELPDARGLHGEERSALAQAYAGSMVSLMSWWVRRKHTGTTRLSAEQVDDLFHRAVWNGI